MGLNLYREFESLRLRQVSSKQAPFRRFFIYTYPKTYPKDIAIEACLALLLSMLNANLA